MNPLADVLVALAVVAVVLVSAWDAWRAGRAILARIPPAGRAAGDLWWRILAVYAAVSIAASLVGAVAGIWPWLFTAALALLWILVFIGMGLRVRPGL